MKLIDADALKGLVCDEDCTECKTEVSKTLCKWGLIQRQEFINLLDNAPTIDAVSVVRCEDCRYKWHCHETVGHTMAHDGFMKYWAEPIEWCSMGKRRDDETD